MAENFHVNNCLKCNHCKYVRYDFIYPITKHLYKEERVTTTHTTQQDQSKPPSHIHTITFTSITPDKTHAITDHFPDLKDRLHDLEAFYSS